MPGHVSLSSPARGASVGCVARNSVNAACVRSRSIDMSADDRRHVGRRSVVIGELLNFCNFGATWQPLPGSELGVGR